MAIDKGTSWLRSIRSVKCRNKANLGLAMYYCSGGSFCMMMDRAGAPEEALTSPRYQTHKVRTRRAFP